jgi:histidinol-phosphate phosphatase family protein
LASRAVFLDRDGTVNEEVNYLSKPENFRLLPGAALAIRLLKAQGWRVIVISNQSGVARGYYTESDVAAIHERLRADLAQAGTGVDAIYYCPHHPDDACACRKPGTLLFEQAARDCDLDLAASYVVGDKQSDLLPGKRLGCATILVLTGYGRRELALAGQQGCQPDYIAADLYQAAKWILHADENTVRL